MLVTIMVRLAALIVVAFTLLAQNTGRLAELTAKGIAYLDQGKFNDAVNALEQVWEQDQSDPAVAESLAWRTCTPITTWPRRKSWLKRR